MPEQAYKRCWKCEESKPLDDFYRCANGAQGRQSSCKPCGREVRRLYREENAERIAATTKRWQRANPERMAAAWRRHRKRNPEKSRAAKRAYSKKRSAYDVARQLGTPEGRARTKVRNAVCRGQLTKPDRCEHCGKQFAPRLLHGHHEDYSKPLEVEWLCAACHGERHRKGDTT